MSDTIKYEIELYDVTGTQTVNISHELVYMGVAQGSAQCLQVFMPCNVFYVFTDLRHVLL